MADSEDKIFTFPQEILNYEKKIYDQRQLIEISRALNSTLDYKYLINAVIDVCLAQMQTFSAALFLIHDMDSDYLDLNPDLKGFDLIHPISYYRLKLESRLIEFLKGTNKAYTLLELMAKEQLHNEKEIQILKELGAHLVIPMKAKGNIIGLIVLGEKIVGTEYTHSEKEFLVDLASLGAIAVDNAWLYERATNDLMTGLKNHAYFQSRLKDEREKALKRGTPLYLMMSDVDKFKSFNDTHGHQAGDEVLKAVAKQLQKIAKSPFFAARYGGEEFCLVMPGLTSDQEAYAIGEEYRKSVEALEIPYENKILKVTVSAGIARFEPNLDAKTNKNLIERADKALYECKRRGRNQVIIYSKDLDT
ncbi:MAG: sensor domain-containing diguanylate cyclase [Leptospiraceae bacterium]|nr:sensor domain-containing diguanylate cyclase [Leptospiraceae bacterium]MDW7975378.1 sensor domain-containing diguanylate cyclase [Leptospiraceae bacterium]